MIEKMSVFSKGGEHYLFEGEKIIGEIDDEEKAAYIVQACNNHIALNHIAVSALSTWWFMSNDPSLTEMERTAADAKAKAARELLERIEEAGENV
jgi:hypothetical protein